MVPKFKFDSREPKNKSFRLTGISSFPRCQSYVCAKFVTQKQNNRDTRSFGTWERVFWHSEKFFPAGKVFSSIQNPIGWNRNPSIFKEDFLMENVLKKVDR